MHLLAHQIKEALDYYAEKLTVCKQIIEKDLESSKNRLAEIRQEREFNKLQKTELSSEAARRKDFIIECKMKLAEMKNNLCSKSEDFKAVLEDLKSMTEEFIKTLN